MTDRGNDQSYHRPVLAEQVAELLVTDPRGTYLDLTVGGGGHLLVLANRLEASGRLYGADVDPEAVERTERALRDVSQFRQVIRTAFADIDKVVAELEEDRFDGILLDLGISSYQLDEPERGISFQSEGPLDMRFNRGSGITAGELVNNLEQKKLKEIISEYGEERQAARIAGAIVRERQKGMILTTTQLKDVVLSVARKPHTTKTLARVFQALRIAVNQELEQLSRVLPVALSLLREGGRLAVISYHSLEDRIVKRFFRLQEQGICTCPPGLPDCVCGAHPIIKVITRKPIGPSADEIIHNPRARSARLRVAEKTV